MVSLALMTEEWCRTVAVWRNKVPEALRTPIMLNEDQQSEFYRRVICDRHALDRYWALMNNGQFFGMGGLTGIQWENGIAEISLILDPERSGKGYGYPAVDALLEMGFDRMGLRAIWGEVYDCNPHARLFWANIAEAFKAHQTQIPYRKWWKGQMHGATWFTIDAENYRNAPELRTFPA